MCGGFLWVAPGGLSQGLGRSSCGLLWASQLELLYGLSGVCTGLSRFALAAIPWAQGGVDMGCFVFHSPHFIVSQSQMSAGLLQFILPQCGAGVGYPGSLSPLSPVAQGEVNIGLLWMAPAGLSWGSEWSSHGLL